MALHRAAGISLEMAMYDTPVILAGHILAAYQRAEGNEKVGRRKSFGKALREQRQRRDNG